MSYAVSIWLRYVSRFSPLVPDAVAKLRKVNFRLKLAPILVILLTDVGPLAAHFFASFTRIGHRLSRGTRPVCIRPIALHMWRSARAFSLFFHISFFFLLLLLLLLLHFITIINSSVIIISGTIVSIIIRLYISPTIHYNFRLTNWMTS